MDIDVLISTVPYDIHAGAVSMAVEAHGGTSLRWYTSGFPLFDNANFFINNDSVSTSIKLSNNIIKATKKNIGTFWFRRTGDPYLSKNLHPSDVDFSQTSCKLMRNMLIKEVCHNARFSVNPIENAYKVENSKLYQLQSAKYCGFKIPETLISNSPDDIRAFINSSRTRVIFKSFFLMSWDSPGTESINFTSFVTEDNLPASDILRSCPGIFQKEVQKEYELRVNVFCSYVITTIVSNKNKKTELDWRISNKESPVEVFDLPRDIEFRCVELIRFMGLKYASIDIIVDQNGEFVFLEVNQQGQFLWLEENNPEIYLLDTFAQFLLSKDDDFKGPSKSPKISFNEVRGEAWHSVKNDLKQYKNSIPIQNSIVTECL